MLNTQLKIQPKYPHFKTPICSANGKRYRYGFNGKEKDNETYGEGNAYDFGARIYDSRLGRWLSLDPFFNKYPYLSSYCAFGNSPISIIDIKGEKIFIYSEKPMLAYNSDGSVATDADGNELYTNVVEYKPGMKVPDDEFASQVVEALNYLHSNSKTAKKSIDNAVNESEELSIKKITPQISKYTGNVFVDKKKIGWVGNWDKLVTPNTIYWDPSIKMGVLDNDRNGRKLTGKAQSPAMSLMHEILHFNDQCNNPKRFFRSMYIKDFSKLRSKYKRGYDNRAEVTVINIEKQIATELGEGVRDNHRGQDNEAKSVTDHENIQTSSSSPKMLPTGSGR